MSHQSSYNINFPWGKYKGLSIGYVHDTNPQYIAWLSTSDFSTQWAQLAVQVMRGDDVSSSPLYNPSSKISFQTKGEISQIKSGKLGVRFDPEDKGFLARFKMEIDGRKWNHEEKLWEFPAVQLLKVVEVFGGKKNIITDDKVKKIYEKELNRKEELHEISQKEDVEIDIPLLLPARDYQRVAVKFIERAGGRAMVADEPGVGKTVTAIAYAIRNELKTIIVCPKSVVSQWAKEIKRFTGKPVCIWTTDGKEGRTDHRFHVINYDIVNRYVDKLNELDCDLLVCDEATNLKNRRTIRAKSVLGDGKKKKEYPGIKTKHVVFLTGTPVLNRPIEAFYLLNFLSKDRFNNFFHFTQKYGGWKGDQPRNLDELHQRTKELVIRRRFVDVMEELPPKQRNDIIVEMSAKDSKEYTKMLNEVFRKWKSSGKPTVAEMPVIQQYLSTKKIPRLIELIDEMLENDRPVLIFSCFIDPLYELHKHYPDNSVVYEGSLNDKERQQAVEALASGKKKIGLFGLKSGGMGIDSLQNTISTAIMMDMDWVPANHQQAEGRIYRSGQTEKVQIYYMVCENTIDEYMREILMKKQEIADTIVDGKVLNIQRDKSFFKEFVQQLKTSYYTDQLKLVDFKEIDD